MLLGRPVMVRRGPGLLGAMARTAVVAGTASAVAGGVNRRQQQKYAAQDAQAAGPQDAAAPAPQAASSGADSGGGDIERLRQLGELREAGVLTDQEFSAEKAKILNG
ncbi:MAG TPA: SHOCT domain-containing protein [Actinocrinis sp.]|nr:SHOCT domain-containing protein [Actinocrinis sp.]